MTPRTQVEQDKAEKAHRIADFALLATQELVDQVAPGRYDLFYYPRSSALVCQSFIHFAGQSWDS